MFGPPGYAYVYLIYGIYHCLNFVTEAEGYPAAVLIRALEPDPLVVELKGLDGRELGRPDGARATAQGVEADRTDGPGRLCRALGIDRSFSGERLDGPRLAVLTGDRPLDAARALPTGCHWTSHRYRQRRGMEQRARGGSGCPKVPTSLAPAHARSRHSFHCPSRWRTMTSGRDSSPAWLETLPATMRRPPPGTPAPVGARTQIRAGAGALEAPARCAMGRAAHLSGGV
jgi:hypothetical protein